MPDPRLPAGGPADVQIVEAYMLFRRTLIDQRLGEAGPKPRHMEILIDLLGRRRREYACRSSTPATSARECRSSIGLGLPHTA